MTAEILYSEWDNDIAVVSAYIDEFLYDLPRYFRIEDIVKRYYEKWAATEILSRCIENAPCPIDLVILDYIYDIKDRRKGTSPNVDALYSIAIETAYDILKFLQEG